MSIPTYIGILSSNFDEIGYSNIYKITVSIQPNFDILIYLNQIIFR